MSPLKSRESTDSRTVFVEGSQNAGTLKKIFNFWMVFLLIVVSGNPFISSLAGGRAKLIVVTFLVFSVAWLFNPRRFPPKYVIVIAFFALVSLAHLVAFGGKVMPSAIGQLLLLFTVSIAVLIIPNIWVYFVRIMSGLAWTSIVLQTPVWLGYNAFQIVAGLGLPSEASDRATVIIHNYSTLHLSRNMGMFWEPGAYAGYLMLALMIVVFRKDEVGDLSKYAVLGLILALFSTMSTTGYLAFSVLGLFYIIRIKRIGSDYLGLGLLPLILITILLVGYIAYVQLPFLSDKVDHQFASVVLRDSGWELTRFGNLLYDLELIRQHPILGWSMNIAGRGYQESVLEITSRQGNGLSGFVVDFGVLSLAVYLGSLFRFFKGTVNSIINSFAGTLIVALLLMGEQFLNFHLFWLLAFPPIHRAGQNGHVKL